MSEWGKVPKEAFTDSRLTRGDVRVLGILCAHANGRTGLCTRKQGTIAEEIGVSRETVNRSLQKLAKLGYVQPRQRPGMKRSLDYRIVSPMAVPAPPARSKRQKVAIKQSVRTAVFERDAYRGRQCGSHEGLQADHIIPEAKGGEASLANLQTLCRSCNRSKGARP